MKKIFKRIWKLYNKWVVILFLITILSVIAGLVIPYLNGTFIDILIATNSFNMILQYAVIIIIVGIINSFVIYIMNKIKIKLIVLASYNYKKEILSHLRNIPLLEFLKYNPSYLNQRSEQDINIIFGFIIENYATICLTFLQLITLFIVLFNFNTIISVIAILFIPIYMIVYIKFKNPLYLKTLNQKESSNKLFSIFNEQYELMEHIKIESNYEIQDRLIQNHFNDYLNKSTIFAKITGLFASLNNIIPLTFQVITFIYGGLEVIRGHMSIGQLTIINVYFSMLLSSLKYYFSLGKKYQTAKVSLERLLELNNLEEESIGEIILDKINIIKANINFSFDKKNVLLDQIEILAESGDVVSIAGNNGIGKTTMIKVLLGLFRSDQSLIAYNNIKIDRLNMPEMRRKSISYVSQDITFNNINVSEIIGDSIDYNLDDFIICEKQFLHKVWNKNINELSRGEKQKIAIIRAIKKRTSIVFFDEPTTNLDSESKMWFYKAVNYMRNQGNIIFIITHNKEVISLCNKNIEIKAKT